MPQTINTNIASLNAQRNLNTSQTALAVSLQRLSSGLRINSAKDDAAGLAISERFTTQIRGLNQAARNANDGISLAQTAEGALGEIGNNLQRIRELAVQSSNATNSATDQAALQAEVSQLLQEINRVADQTSFNGKKLLDGSFSAAVFQVGANANESITVSSIVDANTAVLGGTTTQSTVSVAASSITGFATAVNTWSVNGVTLRALGAASNSAERAGQVVNALNEVSQQSGVGAAYDGATGQITLTTTGTITFAGADATVVNVGYTGAQTLATTSTTGIATLSVASYTTAQLAIAQVDNALGQVNTARANLGAIQNRFQSTVTNLQTTAENLTASRSRIQDADIAAETASLTRGQILQQAGTAMLAQANALPQNVLSLLRG